MISNHDNNPFLVIATMLNLKPVAGLFPNKLIRLNGQKDGRMDGQTDGQTDIHRRFTRNYRVSRSYNFTLSKFFFFFNVGPPY